MGAGEVGKANETETISIMWTRESEFGGEDALSCLISHGLGKNGANRKVGILGF